MCNTSGRDESRNTLRDPTLRDRELGRGAEEEVTNRTAGLGSSGCKHGQKGRRD